MIIPRAKAPCLLVWDNFLYPVEQCPHSSLISWELMFYSWEDSKLLGGDGTFQGEVQRKLRRGSSSFQTQCLLNWLWACQVKTEEQLSKPECTNLSSLIQSGINSLMELDDCQIVYECHIRAAAAHGYIPSFFTLESFKKKLSAQCIIENANNGLPFSSSL